MILRTPLECQGSCSTGAILEAMYVSFCLLGIPEPATIIYRIPLRKKSGYDIECQAETIKK